MRMIALFCAASTMCVSLAAAETLPTKVVHEQLPSSKQTVAKLYVTSEEL